jgi:ankyrin repeat protein
MRERNYPELKKLLDQCGLDVRDSRTKRTVLFEEGLPEDFLIWLLENGAQINVRDWTNRTPLHEMVRENSAGAEILIQAGAYLEALDNWQQTPLHEAAGQLQTRSVFTLMAFGAEIDPRNYAGLTPLELALEKCRFQEIDKMVEIAEILLEGGAQVTDLAQVLAQEICHDFDNHQDAAASAGLKKILASMICFCEMFRVETGFPSGRQDMCLFPVKGHIAWKTYDIYNSYVPAEGEPSTIQGKTLKLARDIFTAVFESESQGEDQNLTAKFEELLSYLRQGPSPLAATNLKLVAKLASKAKKGQLNENYYRLVELAAKWVLNYDSIVFAEHLNDPRWGLQPKDLTV